MFDTHCHLNFSRFKKNVDEVIKRAHEAGVSSFIVPGTDIESSKKAIKIAENNDGIYAAVGIHPHHVFEYISRHSDQPVGGEESIKLSNRSLSAQAGFANAQDDMEQLKRLLLNQKVVAVGEIGLDKHVYEDTKYESYHVTPEFFTRQKDLLIKQLKLAATYKKSVILHNREAVDDMLDLLNSNWDNHFEWRTVFHCCEPNEKLLEFAKNRHIFIGVDGDITYDKPKQEFIKNIPLEFLVVETDSPFLLPEPFKTRREYPNEPKNIPLIIKFISNILNVSSEDIAKITTQNAKRLFSL